ncbi:Arc family DNA-binding protein [Aminobacter sp. MSH1]|uniref:Arc family DNA-binding protein n=1 Tax=Aminobacter sp. MSH1 TaxID=374606 RepID=UPI0018FF5BCA|nr:Arc family DNA-binding protein [Aminobacter sp. MSH1]
MARNDPQVAVRLPPDVKAFIKAEARENASSQNSEIVRAIRAAMKAKGPAEAATSPSHVTHQHP